MLITIYFASNTRDSMFYERGGSIYNEKMAKEAIENGLYTQMGTHYISGNDVMEALEEAYALSQNIDAPWRPESPCRSMSVGDVARVNGENYIVAKFGFERI